MDETAIPGEGRRAARKGRHRPRVRAILLSAVVAVAAVALGFGVHRWVQSPQASTVRVSGIPSDVPTSVADLMTLSPVPNRAAPDFTLVDQRGQTVSLSGLRGRAVVLGFMDPHCTDICPIVSQEFVDAYRDLGSRAARAVFLSVNVNPFHNSPADMAAYSHEQGLDTIPSWHFLTGPVPALRAVWSHYGIGVSAPNPEADVLHTSILYFIDAHGVERFIASPMVDHTMKGASFLPAPSLRAWGKGIALVAADVS